MVNTPEPEPSPARELASFVGRLALVGLLAAGCSLAPFAAAIFIRPWLGMVMAVGAFYVWGRFGPRPFPGLLPGLLCLGGHAAILGSFLWCAILAVRSL